MTQRHAWDELAEKYEEEVFSLTRFPERREQMIRLLPTGLILNLGCGSIPYLTQDIIRNGCRVVATDYSGGMIRSAKRKYGHERLRYSVADSRSLPFSDFSFDAVVSSNSILPPERWEIAVMVAEVFRVLKQDGVFVAFFPSFDNVVRAIKNLGVPLIIDANQLRVKDTGDYWQCFHTPHSIADTVVSAGFDNFSLTRVNLSSEAEIRELERLYGVDSSSSYIYEYLVVAHKNT